MGNMFHESPAVKKRAGDSLRMERAKQLLLTTDLSLAAVSEAVGFNDYFYFMKKFKISIISPWFFSRISQYHTRPMITVGTRMISRKLTITRIKIFVLLLTIILFFADISHSTRQFQAVSSFCAPGTGGFPVLPTGINVAQYFCMVKF